MKRNPLLRRLLLVIIAILASLLVWSFTPHRPPPCKPGHEEERDATGKVVKITSRVCPPVH